jgi:hypothetical protein
VLHRADAAKISIRCSCFSRESGLLGGREDSGILIDWTEP